MREIHENLVLFRYCPYVGADLGGAVRFDPGRRQVPSAGSVGASCRLQPLPDSEGAVAEPAGSSLAVGLGVCLLGRGPATSSVVASAARPASGSPPPRCWPRRPPGRRRAGSSSGAVVVQARRRRGWVVVGRWGATISSPPPLPKASPGQPGSQSAAGPRRGSASALSTVLGFATAASPTVDCGAGGDVIGRGWQRPRPACAPPSKAAALTSAASEALVDQQPLRLCAPRLTDQPAWSARPEPGAPADLQQQRRRRGRATRHHVSADCSPTATDRRSLAVGAVSEASAQAHLSRRTPPEALARPGAGASG